ncbi:unnamed protein product [Paramecium primaurelia]|uniref:Transmembrane protein n=1 Tax=Paramecium primaurelia TaxID=5886 RepID=A0A8S1KI59_PARPR|nr:unnamed protein product [Paramecium primaurelia]
MQLKKKLSNTQNYIQLYQKAESQQQRNFCSGYLNLFIKLIIQTIILAAVIMVYSFDVFQNTFLYLVSIYNVYWKDVHFSSIQDQLFFYRIRQIQQVLIKNSSQMSQFQQPLVGFHYIQLIKTKKMGSLRIRQDNAKNQNQKVIQFIIMYFYKYLIYDLMAEW